ncbi:O-antigen ligase family protein [Telmatocola sphagniphila]|uniref:O-antigen ligase family protein n=1 Tax=Telmatocola sphagniphila TaxID=1123043 RepID=A0A8E6EXE1_9BACT|nr:O-antigen ligase family protein [Telmatocola sphagniphila]QVL31166.1 O-antigen ligase family protein [Telmatocola sphagniphila]
MGFSFTLRLSYRDRHFVNQKSVKPKSVFQILAEWLVLTVVFLSPWYFGSVDSRSILVLHCALIVLSLLYTFDVLLNPSRKWMNCPIGLLLGAVIVWSVIQLLPIPNALHKILTPGSFALCQDMLPNTAETLLNGEPLPSPQGNNSLSICKYETQRFTEKVLYLFIFYAVLRNMVVSRGFLRKLVYLCLINGFLLSIVGIAKHFGPLPKRVLWTLEVTDAYPFSAFINRDHFAFYANLCVGLGLSLLSVDRSARTTDYMVSKGISTNWRERLVNGVSDVFSVLQNPKIFWVIALLLCILTAILLTQARGAYIGTASGIIVAIFIWSRLPSNRIQIPLMAIVPLCLGSMAIFWFASGYFESKLTDQSIDKQLNSRLPIWGESIRLLPKFGLFGSGGGTYRIVEPLARSTEDMIDDRCDHAHNEYLEALVEGGVPRFLITLAIVWILMKAGYRACRVHAQRSSYGLAIGCVFSLVTAFVHSIGEFAIHLGSVAILVCVISAATMSLAYDYDHRKPSSSRFLAVVSAALFPLLAMMLTWESWKQNDAEVLMRQVEKDAQITQPSLTLEKRLAFSEAAMKAQPKDPEVILNYASCLAESARLPDTTPAQGENDIRKALNLWASARNLSLLHPQPHARIGYYREHLASGDSASTYLERAKRLFPTDSKIWFACGQAYYDTNDFDKAWSNWKQALSLKLNERMFRAVLTQAKARLSPSEIVDLVAPNQVETLQTMMNLLYPSKEEFVEERSPFLSRIMEISKADPVRGNMKPEHYHIRGLIEWELKQYPAAEKDFQSALLFAPTRSDWRIEHGLLLREMGFVNKNPDLFGKAIVEFERVRYEPDKADIARYWIFYIERELDLRGLRKEPDSK